LNWLHRFTQKYKLSYRKLTHYSPKSFQEVEDFILEFLHEVHRIRATENIIPDMRQVIKPLVLWQRTKEEFKDQKALLI